MEMSFLIENISVIWLIAGAIFVFLEASSVPGIGFLFAGLAAIIVGGLISIGAISQDNITIQFSWFFGFTALWAIILWKPMKRLRYNTSDKEYKNIIGNTATVKNTPLTKQKTGKVEWSGTIVKARIAGNSKTDSIPVDEDVKIMEIKDGNFLVLPIGEATELEKSEDAEPSDSDINSAEK